MSGSTIPYHLRQNKAIERSLFFDLLHRIGRHPGFNISAYHYVGFGGPFMEDFKQVHAALRIEKMTCIEKNEDVIKRQKFNHPIAGIEYFSGLSGEYLTQFVRGGETIFWLDYTTSELRKQLMELSDLVGKLAHGDVFKITLNCQPNNLESALFRPGDPKQLDNRKQQYERRLGDLTPQGLNGADFNLENYPAVLSESVKRAVERAFLHKPNVGIPLTSFAYKDGQQMFTLTGMVLDRDKQDSFFASTRIAEWPFATLGWARPQRIRVPDLSIKERQHLEGLLPYADKQELLGALGFNIQDDAGNTLVLLESLRRFYRFLPQYGRVAF